MLVQDFVRAIDDRIDLSRAASWDIVGLQIGSPTRPVGRVGVCHEVTPQSVSDIVADGINTVVSYHPLIFEPTTTFVDGPTAGGRAFRLAVAGVSVVVVHTAFDAAPGGAADALAATVGLSDPIGFGCQDGDPRSCIGRIGAVPSTTLDQMASAVSRDLRTRVKISGDPGLEISTAAVVPGSGGSFVPESMAADVLITGDVKHHEATAALENGLAVIDAGHIPTERPGFDALYDAIITIAHDVHRIGSDPYPWKD